MVRRLCRGFVKADPACRLSGRLTGWIGCAPGSVCGVVGVWK